MDDFVAENKGINAHSNQRIVTMEDNLNKKLDGLKNDIDQNLDILQESISELTNQLVHQEEENPEGGCLVDTMVEEQCQQ